MEAIFTWEELRLTGNHQTIISLYYYSLEPQATLGVAMPRHITVTVTPCVFRHLLPSLAGQSQYRGGGGWLGAARLAGGSISCWSWWPPPVPPARTLQATGLQIIWVRVEAPPPVQWGSGTEPWRVTTWLSVGCWVWYSDTFYLLPSTFYLL